MIWEYTQDTCDVWQVAHLCNHMADHGWDTVAVFESHRNVQPPAVVGDSTGPRAATSLRPYAVLFRRPLQEEKS